MKVQDLQWSADDGRKRLGPLSFELQSGEALAVLGPARSGKTSLLEVLLTAREPLDGDLTLSSAAETGELTPIAGVPERFFGYRDLTVADDLLLHGYVLGMSLWRRGSAVRRILSRVGLQGDRPAGELTRDEEGLLLVARALLGKPRVLLLDEPLEGLSPEAQERIRGLLEEQRAEGARIVWATREPNSLPIGIDRLVLLLPSGCHGPLDLNQADQVHQLDQVLSQTAGWDPGAGGSGAGAVESTP